MLYALTGLYVNYISVKLGEKPIGKWSLPYSTFPIGWKLFKTKTGGKLRGSLNDGESSLQSSEIVCDALVHSLAHSRCSINKVSLGQSRKGGGGVLFTKLGGW